MWAFAFHSAKQINKDFLTFHSYQSSRTIVIEEMKWNTTNSQVQGSKESNGHSSSVLKSAVHCEAYPQAILQCVTMWKRPLACFEWNFDTSKLLLDDREIILSNLKNRTSK